MDVKQKSFSCPTCGKLYERVGCYERHVALHTLRYKCDMCAKSFKTKEGLQKHKSQMHTDSLCCKQCWKLFKNKTALLEHSCKYIHVPTMSCHCGKSFATKAGLSSHQAIHSSQFGCEVCGKRCKNHHLLTVHRVYHHSDSKQWKFKCKFCKKKFPLKLVRDRHLINIHKMKTFNCDECGMKYKFKEGLKKHHLATGHFSKQLISKCALCLKSFRSVSGFLLHQTKCLKKNKVYFCEICKIDFTCGFDLSEHLEDHRRENGCEICSRTFLTPFGLKKHLVVHANGVLNRSASEETSSHS